MGRPKLIATVNNLIELGQAKRALQQRVQGEQRQRRALERGTTCAAWCSRTRPRNA
jgi:hypothetical protein